ncbi:MAG: winged helix-turn-helix domain-containing protein [Nanoarchaeota archaeon]|nr:winged helix-turn-helix domain-containing protein [Nanoarchaeota archaeon]MBU4242466.1 winged helix-turn-helix domain-containing protein [Nanoarchaeota archaeon]MBU4352009.1 winged helix-turn-helix domain-containing protein [Nanoarchaeota archaeon]MBU4456812.1 winged helix-turn-helix domain-containing protein [Nanoarchaeota archaeon]MCG2719394.1 winged helix-turn-helix domain-containing protein [Nanoarchaeota archaeon]
MIKHPELISFILRAKNRKRILSLLEKEYKLPAQLMKETGMYKSHVSRTLKELKDKRLIACKNPDDHTFRFYTLTKKGKVILKEVKEELV